MRSRKSENNLQKNLTETDWYRRLFEVETDAIFLIDRDTLQIIDVNQAAMNMYGYSRDELLSMKATDVSADPELSGRSIAGHDSHASRYHRRKDGTAFPVEISASYFALHGRNVLAGAVRDITGRVETEGRLVESEERYRSFFENSMDGILLTAPEGRIFSANAAACDILQMSEEEICRRGRSGLVDTDDPALQAGVELRDRTGKFFGELTFIRSNGSRFRAEVSSSIFKSINGRDRATVIFRDITERKQAEEALRGSEEQLRVRTMELEEMNSALSVLLKQREQDKKDTEEKMLANMENLVYPFIEKLKKKVVKEDAAYLNIIEANLQQLLSPFTVNLTRMLEGLSPQELLVAKLVKEGRQDKEVSELLHLSIHTIKAHRRNIRRKLDLRGKEVNLRAYLANLTDNY